MIHPLVRDAAGNPDLFDFKLPCSSSEIVALESAIRKTLPPSYHEVLERLGQGSFFDNETLLGVHEAEEGIGDLESVNRELHDKQGLDEDLVVFHIGSGGLHAFDTAGGGPEWEVVALNEDTLARGDTYENFETWYEERMRPEFEDLLGLE